MGAQKTPIVVLMDDGRELLVEFDQRDRARLEAADVPDAMFTTVRFLAWSVLNRTKQYDGTFEQFNLTDCVEVSDPPGAEEAPAEEEAGDGPERLDPGRSDRSAAT